MHRVTPARPAALLALLMTGVAMLAAALFLVPGAASAGSGWTPPPDTVVSVRGSADDGFSIRHYDGSMHYPPTTSEAIAECGEYAHQRDRIRCRTRVRTWYRDLRGLQATLRWASQRG